MPSRDDPQGTATDFWEPESLRLKRERRAAGLCSGCGTRPGTIRWGDALAVTHGWTELRCGVCVYGAQLRHALSCTIRIPILTAKLIWAFIDGLFTFVA